MNKEIPKIQNQTPYFLTQALQLFLKDITEVCIQIQDQHQLSKIGTGHVRKAIEENERFHFLKDLVKDEEELGEVDEQEVAKVRHKRKERQKQRELQKKRREMQQMTKQSESEEEEGFEEQKDDEEVEEGTEEYKP